MKVTYRTRYPEILSTDIVNEIKRLTKVQQGDLAETEIQQLRKRLLDDSLDLRLKKESVTAIARSQFGIETSGDIPKEKFDQTTTLYLQKISGKIPEFADLMTQDGSYWLTNPQRYEPTLQKSRFGRQLATYGVGYVLLQSWRRIVDFDLVYPSLAVKAPKECKDRIVADIEWMLDNQCTLGVCTKDLSHAHICYRIDEGGKYRIGGLNESDEMVRNLIHTDPRLMTTQAIISEIFHNYRKTVLELGEVVVANQNTMHILYHTFEDTNPNHPFYVNRTVLSSTSNRVCFVPTHGELGLGAEDISGISELAVRFMFRINSKSGNSNINLSNIEIYITPTVGRI